MSQFIEQADAIDEAKELDALHQAHAQTVAVVSAFVADYKRGPDHVPVDRNAAMIPLERLLAFIGPTP